MEKNKIATKQTKVITKRRKFIKVEIPLTRSRIHLVANSPEELENKTVKLDLTRQLKGKNVEATVQIKVEKDKAIAYPKKIRLMPYFIRRIIRKRISYVEDSFETPSQENILRVKPFLITRKRVSKAVRKTLRNKAKNWIEDYIKERTNDEIFNDILSNRLQKPLSLVLKKTYPLSLCEIRILEVKRTLKPEEVPKITKKKKEEETEDVIDQLKEIEDEKIKQAEKEIKDTQEKAVKKDEGEEATKTTDNVKEDKSSKSSKEESSKTKEDKPTAKKKTTKKEEK